MADFDRGEELGAAGERLARKRKVRAMLDDLFVQRRELSENESRLREACAKEEKDVQRLEHGSLATMFYEISGGRAEKLDRERAEAYAAAVKHDSARSAVEGGDRRDRRA